MQGAGGHGEAEGAAFAHDAADGDVAAEEFRQPFADGQPQARAAESPAGGSVALGKGLKEARHLVGRYSNSRVTHVKLHFGLAVVALNQACGHAHPSRAR